MGLTSGELLFGLIAFGLLLIFIDSQVNNYQNHKQIMAKINSKPTVNKPEPTEDD